MKIYKLPQSDLINAFNKFLFLASTDAEFNLMRRLINDFYIRQSIPEHEIRTAERLLEKLEKIQNQQELAQN